MQLSVSRLLVIVSVVAHPVAAYGQPPLHQTIDKHVAAGPDFAKNAAGPASETEFLRRIYLDLTGVIPSTAQARGYLADPAPDKRARLIDQLLASEGYVRHMQSTFDVLLMDRRADKHVKRAEWLEFLRASFRDNRPYDQFVAELLAADGSDAKKRGPAKFFLDRDGEPNLLTKDISRLFLGMNLQCCQCHDHPHVDSYLQEHYYGVQAFLNRSFIYADKGSKLSLYAEKGEGEVSFKSVFKTKVKEARNTGPRVPDGRVLAEPKFEKGQEYVVPYKPGEKPQPKFSRRALLAKEITGPGNARFPRAAVNRLWSLYLGRGIVHPVEFDHPDNPPSHPELLKALTEEFSKRRFDMKALIKEIVLSETYQRSSESRKGVKEAEPALFAVAALRPLTPEQFGWSIIQAAGLLDTERKATPLATDEAIFARQAGNVQAIVNMFARPAGEPFDPSAFEATLDQVLFLKNGPVLRGLLAPRPGSLTQRLADLKDPGAVADELYLSVLSRLPAADERRETADFLAQRGADRPTALQDLTWALLTSAEFRFNH